MNETINGGNRSTSELVGEEIPESARIIFIVVGIVEFLIGMPGNIAIIITVARTKRMRNFHYLMTANLAVADLVYIAYCLPWKMSALVLRRYPVSSSAVCVFNGAVIVVAVITSTMSLLAINVNRYLSVCHRGVFSGTPVSSSIACGLTWSVSIVCSLPAVILEEGMKISNKVYYCVPNRAIDPIYFITCIVVIPLVIPATGIVLSNVAIWRYVRRNLLLAPMEDTSKSQGFLQGSPTEDTSKSQDFLQGSPTEDTSKSQDFLQGSPTEDTSKSQGFIRGSVLSTSSYDESHNADSDVESPKKSRKGVEGVSPSGVSDEKVKVKPKSSVSTTSSIAENLQLEPTIPITTSLAQPMEEEDEDNRHSDNTFQVAAHAITPDELALLKTVITVSLCFVVFTLPFAICSVFDRDRTWVPVVYIMSTILLQANSCVNCVIYGVMIPSFREALIQSMRC